jgi:hypothetical protein
MDLPENFADVTASVTALIDPVVENQVGSLRWNPHAGIWQR